MVDYSTDKTVVKPKCKANAAQRAGLQYGKAEKEGEKHGREEMRITKVIESHSMSRKKKNSEGFTMSYCLFSLVYMVIDYPMGK